MSTAGAVLDGPPATGGIAISTAVNAQSAPALAFDGTNYLVTWTDLRTGNNNIFGARVSTAGSVLDGPTATGGIAISTAAGAQQLPALAFDGTNYLVVWRDNRSGSFDIFGARVSTGGSVLDGPPATGGIAISTAVNTQQLPAVAFDGTNYLVAWGDDRSATDDVFGARVSTGGSVLDGPPATGGIILSTGPSEQRVPAVAFDGTNYFVVWSDFRSGAVDPDLEVFAVPDLFGARVSPTGSILDPRGIVIATGITSAMDTIHGPLDRARLGFDGTNYLVVWTTYNGGTAGARVTTAGEVLDPVPIQIGDGGFFPDVAFNGTNYLVVWLQTDSPFFIRGARVSTAGDVLDPFEIDIGVGGINIFGPGPTVASDGSNFLVVWNRRISSSNYDIFGARVTGGGSLLDGPPDDTGGIPISTAPNSQNSPKVAFDGTRYLVAWGDTRVDFASDLYGARVSTNGSLLDGPPDTGGIPISTTEGGAQGIAANGPFLVVGSGLAFRVRGEDGTVLDPSGFPVVARSITKGPGGGWAVSYTGADATYGANRVFLRTISPK